MGIPKCQTCECKYIVWDKGENHYVCESCLIKAENALLRKALAAVLAGDITIEYGWNYGWNKQDKHGYYVYNKKGKELAFSPVRVEAVIAAMKGGD